MVSYSGLIHRDSLLNSLSLEHLRIFEATARNKSFTRAAAELYTSQPSVSRHIKQLTETIGVPLFEYVDNHIQITPTGEELLIIYQEIFHSLKDFHTKLIDLNHVEQGHLKASAVKTIQYVIPKFLEQFCRLHPDVKIALDFINHEEILNRIQENVDDFYILAYPPKKEDFEIKPFMGNSLVVVAPSNHLLVNQSYISLKQLAKEKLIIQEQGSENRMAVDTLLAEHGIKIQFQLEMNSNNATKQAVLSGLGLAVLSIHTLHPELEQNQISILNVEGFPIFQKWQIIYLKNKWLSPVAITFLNYLQQGSVSNSNDSFLLSAS
ncbi:LysR family transcriptional regulator [Nostoc sp. MS1]|uniref:LysR family transcriptional regulator n=1 Tax=Nostoc sp. MS1 TaxID=2764711 RepID=UPI001CC3F7AD|nr:LysR family transcriptional regulator [Nostoc sp. MS1]BCL33645.1 transcriptional regulator [Nostoc sp. MS1]